MTEPIDERERRELCDLFLTLGPEAPTLCEGWTTLDLAAHLSLREHFKKWPPEKLAAEKNKGLPALVERLRAGAPLVPWRIPGVRTMLNGVEYFIHHEDVRRANGLDRRNDRPDLEAMSARMIGLIGLRAARQIRPHGLTVCIRDGRTKHFGSSDAAVLTGAPTELMLYLSGRRDSAQVSFDGNAAAVSALQNTGTGL